MPDLDLIKQEEQEVRDRRGSRDYSAGRATGMGVFLRAFRHSSKPCNNAKKEGTNSTARQVEAMMPLRTLSPSDMRPLAPAPVASTNGTTPSPKAKEVIRIGRNRRRDASTAASRIDLPWTRRPSRAISTIRMPFLADSAIIRMSPIWV